LSQHLNLNIPITLTLIDRYFENDILSSVLLIDPEEKVIRCNTTLLKFLGYELAEIQGQPIAKFLENKSLSDLTANFNNEDTVNSSELPGVNVIAVDGSKFPSRYSIFALTGKDNKETECYLVILHDIHRGQNLSLLQQFSGTFLKDVNLGVLLINTSFRLIDISDMACRIIGMEKEHILNRPMDEVFSNVPIEHQLVQRTILDGQIVRNHAISWTNNDERYELLMDSNLLKDEQGNTMGAYVIFKDVSNLRSLEEQVQRSDRLAMIGQIAAGTAHEIRNPLTSIKGFLQVFKKTLLDHGLHKEFDYTEIMLKEIDRINELVNEFLLLSKPKNITFSKVNVAKVLREIMPIINNEAILHSVTVQYEAANQLPEVVADQELLKQVCLNICKNGIEAMVEGGILTLAEKVDKANGKIHIEIHDSGPGIPSYLIDKIFDPFFTTKENGTGLGLSVCQRIIHDIGGTIRVKSKGFGTTFTISIPYAKK
jgi:two-component system, sporulation sensor kinase E